MTPIDSARIRQLARQFLDGDLGVINLSRELSAYRGLMSSVEPGLKAALMTFVAIDSETDVLPIDAVRKMWHPSTAALEDKKVEYAERLYKESAADACRRLLELLK